MNEEKTQIADGVASELNAELDTGEEVNLLLVSALRQYQHNDCSGLLIGYDYSETQKIVTELLAKVKNLSDFIKQEAEYSYFLAKNAELNGDVKLSELRKKRGDRFMNSI